MPGVLWFHCFSHPENASYSHYCLRYEGIVPWHDILYASCKCNHVTTSPSQDSPYQVATELSLTSGMMWHFSKEVKGRRGVNFCWWTIHTASTQKSHRNYQPTMSDPPVFPHLPGVDIHPGWTKWDGNKNSLAKISQVYQNPLWWNTLCVSFNLHWNAFFFEKV